MKYPNLLTITLLIFSSNAFSSDCNISFVGGGGEPVNARKTIFDPSLSALGSYLQNTKCNYSLSFNGGHQEADAIMKSQFRNAETKKPFDVVNYNEIINGYINKINSGAIKDGEKILLMIDSHGAKPTGGEKTHDISIGDATAPLNLNDLSNSPKINLSSLNALTNLAAAKGIKLGIVDFSCHSGATLDLANKNTCVISSTGPNHLGVNVFSEEFIKNMKPGKTLENVFLETRRNSISKNYDESSGNYPNSTFPMISTPEGLSINRDLYPNISPYLYYYNPNGFEDKLGDYIIHASSDKGLCMRENQFNKLQSTIEEFRAIGALEMNNMPELARIKELLKNYKATQDRYIKFARTIGIQELSHIEHFGKTAKGDVSWREILETNYEKRLDDLSPLAKSKDPTQRAVYQQYVDGFNKQKEILSKYPKLKNYKNIFKQQMNEMKGTFKIANDISLEERKLYDVMYENLQKKKSAKNPCNDFVL